MQIAEWIVSGAQIYASIGLAIGLIFIFLGIDRLALDARHSWAFRPLLLPGFVLIWPLALWRWMRWRRDN